MNRSYSKIRHIQEANMILENRKFNQLLESNGFKNVDLEYLNKEWTTLSQMLTRSGFHESDSDSLEFWSNKFKEKYGSSAVKQWTEYTNSLIKTSSQCDEGGMGSGIRFEISWPFIVGTPLSIDEYDVENVRVDVIKNSSIWDKKKCASEFDIVYNKIQDSAKTNDILTSAEIIMKNVEVRFKLKLNANKVLNVINQKFI